MRITLRDAARVIRSKNSGPYELTLDVLFADVERYELFKSRSLIDAELIARLYGIPSERISVVWFEPANAVKATMPRRVPSGTPGDTDIYGAQQHGPLLDLEWTLED